MVRRLLGTAAALVVLSIVQTARADDKADLAAAVHKLADAPSYAWTTTSDSQFGRGPADGKTEKGGYTSYIVEFGESIYEVVARGDKAVVKGETGWQTPAELAGGGGEGGFNPALFVALMVESFAPPADALKGWLPKLENLKRTADGFTADLSTDAAKDLMTLRARRPGGVGAAMPPFEVASPKASLKITVKDGAVTKMEMQSSGVFNFNGNENEFARTVTTDIKDVGSAKLTPPDDAKKKLDAAPAAPAATAPAGR